MKGNHCIAFQKFKYFEFQLFFKSYVNSSLFIIMMLAMLIHAKIGCETIVKDYISNATLNFYLRSMINFFAYSALFLVIVAIIKLSIF